MQTVLQLYKVVSRLSGWRAHTQHIAKTVNTQLPCLLMIPGTLCDERIFKKQARVLRNVARIVVADYSRLKARSAWLNGLLACLPERFSLAGFSLGGMFALELVRMAPERVDRLALIASNAQPADHLHRQRSRQLGRILQSKGPDHLVRQLQARYFHHEAARRRHSPLIHSMAIETSRKVAIQQFAWAAQRPSSLITLKDFTRPLLIASGALDRVCTARMQRAMREAQPKALWLHFPRCGHFVPLEAAAQLNGALVRWLREPLI